MLSARRPSRLGWDALSVFQAVVSYGTKDVFFNAEMEVSIGQISDRN